jgi:hypothetical protein
MIYFPETVIQWVQCYWGYLHTIVLLAKHVNSLCASSHPEAVKGSSSSCLLISSRLLASPVRAQLTLTDPNWGPRSVYPQNGVPSHRVRAHSLVRIQNMTSLTVYPVSPVLADLCCVQVFLYYVLVTSENLLPSLEYRLTSVVYWRTSWCIGWPTPLV